VKINPYIIIAEPSAIIFEGLAAILVNSNLNFSVLKAGTLEEIEQLYLRRKSKLIIINPSLIQNNVKSFIGLKNQFANTQWAGLVYAYYDQGILSLPDAILNISDSPSVIITAVSKLLNTDRSIEKAQPQDILSDREIDVLKLITSGLPNKEIAFKLNISINTVITHRRNISQKTGIKSVSGLTIYAVVNKIHTLESLSG
jgi:DNA-binding NarL/FixJ family response regulator